MKRSFKGSSFRSAGELQLPQVQIDQRFLIPASDIIFSSEIGEGSSARVFQGLLKKSPVALKRFKLGKTIPKYQEMLKKEANNILKLKHHNVVECLGVCLPEMTIILEYCCKSLDIDGGNVICHTVRQMIDAIGPSLPQDLSSEALYQITEGMNYLHEQNVIHCDLKSQNVLVRSSVDDENEWLFKISDMGEAHIALDTTYRSTISCTQRGAVGTIPYQAPELLNGNPKYTKAVDVYSYAMIMYELAHADQQYPWQKDCGSSASQIRGLVSKGERPTMTDRIPVWYADMMTQCWCQEPAGRPSFEAVKQMLMCLDVESESSALSAQNLSRSQPPEMKLVQIQSQNEGGAMSGGSNQYFVEDTEILLDGSQDLCGRLAEDQRVMREREEKLEVLRTLTLTRKANTVQGTPQKTLEPDLAEPTEEMLMAWTGFAQKYFKISQLHDYQTKAIACWKTGLDCLIVQSTSSGKSVCFQLPAAMGKDGDMVVVVVPIIALAKDQVQYLQERGVEAKLLGSAAQKGTFTDVFLNKQQPKILYVTPETLMGGEAYKGILGRLLEGHNSEFRVTLFAVDEAHLITEWGGSFRASFDRLSELKHLFPDVPMMALTATLQPKDEEMMRTSILREPLVLRGTIDRANVSLQLYKYKCPKLEGDWTAVAEQIKDVVGEEKAIVYCSFAKTCDSVCSALLHCGMKSAAYTGHNRTAEEKSTIHDNMAAGDIQVLVATQAFGLGVNIKWIRWIIHIGCPQNIPQWVQESGRAGRDGKPASAAIFFSEHADLQRLKFWVNDAKDHAEKSLKIEDFKKVWHYIYSAMAGTCLHHQQKLYFGEDDEPVQAHAENDVCCDGCTLNSGKKYDATTDVKAITEALQELHDLGLKCVTERKLADWLEGKEQDWVKDMSNRDVLEKSPTFGSKQNYQSTLHVVLRQAVGLDIVSLVILITKVKGHWNIVTKYFAFSDENKSALSHSKALFLPHPEDVQKHLTRVTEKETCKNPCKEKIKKQGYGMKGNRILIQILEDGDWEPITKKENYINVGFDGGLNTLLYAEDFSNLPGCPVSLNKEDFLWNDVAMGKGSGFPKKKLDVVISGETTSVFIKKNPCSGVKKCSGDDCSFATSKRHRENRCLRHQDSLLQETGKCPGIFVYIRPAEITDKRRWLGFFSDGDDGHNHPCPVGTKPGSQLEEMVAVCVKRDPTKTPRELAKGYGLPCFPGAISPAGASTSCLAKLRYKYLIDTGSATAINLVRQFDVLIKSQIDSSDSLHQVDGDKEVVQQLTTPYLRWWNASDDLLVAVFMTPQMSQILALSTFVEADVTFPGCQVMKYMLNVVTFNELTLKWQVVARALMSRMTTAAYKAAFNKILDVVTEGNPEFKRGQETSAWVVDFSDAQSAALEDTLGETALKVIRGCKVHYIRLCHRIADKVCCGEEERQLFLLISTAIPDVKESGSVDILFDALCGKIPPSQLPEDVLRLQPSQKQLKCEGWKAAKSWVAWWKRPRHTRMLCTSFKDMNDSIWEISPSSTNAVESRNKESKPQTCSVKATLEHIYRCDRAAAYEAIAAEQGIAVAPSQSTRIKQRSLQKRWRRKRVKLVASEASMDNTETADGAQENVEQTTTLKRKHDEEAQTAVEARGNVEQTTTLKKKHEEAGPSRTSSMRSRSKRTSTEQHTPLLDQSVIGKSILLDTEGHGGKRYGFQEAKVVAIEGKFYKAQFKKWPTHFAFFDDIASDDVTILDS